MQQVPSTNCGQVLPNSLNRNRFKFPEPPQVTAEDVRVRGGPNREGVKDLERRWKTVLFRDVESITEDMEFAETGSVTRGIRKGSTRRHPHQELDERIVDRRRWRSVWTRPTEDPLRCPAIRSKR